MQLDAVVYCYLGSKAYSFFVLRAGGVTLYGSEAERLGGRFAATSERSVWRVQELVVI